MHQHSLSCALSRIRVLQAPAGCSRLRETTKSEEGEKRERKRAVSGREMTFFPGRKARNPRRSRFEESGSCSLGPLPSTGVCVDSHVLRGGCRGQKRPGRGSWRAFLLPDSSACNASREKETSRTKFPASLLERHAIRFLRDSRTRILKHLLGGGGKTTALFAVCFF